MNMLETYNLQSSAYYNHLTEASYDLAAAAAAAAAATKEITTGTTGLTGIPSPTPPTSVAVLQAHNATLGNPALTDSAQSPVAAEANGSLTPAHAGSPSIIPKLEFEKGKNSFIHVNYFIYINFLLIFDVLLFFYQTRLS